MTVITGLIKNAAGELASGTLTVKANKIFLHGGAVIDGNEHTVDVVNGVFTLPDIAPGPIKLIVDCGNWRKTFEKVLPDQASITFAALIESTIVYEPEVVSAAVQAAADAAGSAADAAATLAAVEAGAVPDSAVAAKVLDTTSETRAALNETYATPADIPPIVADAIAAEPTVVSAAATAADAAVDAEVTSRALIGESDGRIQTLTGPTRTNFVKNPAVNVNTTGWALWAGSGGAASSVRVADGAGWAFKLTWTTGTDSVSGEIGPGRTNVDDVPVTAGDVITASVDAEVGRVQRLRCVATFYDAANAMVGSIVYGSSQSVAAGVRTRLGAANITVPAGATHMTARISSVSGTDGSNWIIGDTLLATKALVEKATTVGTYFDGSTSGAAWSGTANDSASTMKSVKTPAPAESPVFTGSATLNGIALANINNVATESAKAMKPRAGWTAATTYAVYDLIYQSGIFYYCVSAHTSSSTFAADKASKWRIFSPMQLSVMTPPASMQDYVAAMWARANPELHPFPVAVSYLASGFSLTTQLGAGHTEHVYDASPPIRTLGVLPTVITAASTTFQGNASNGSAVRQPYDLEFIVTVPTEADGKLLISVHDTAIDPKPGVGVWIDGRPTVANFVRDGSPSTTTMRGILIDGIGAGRHLIRLTLQSMDWRSVAVPAGVTVTKTTDVRKKLFILGDSWIEGGTEASPHATWPHAIAPSLARMFGPTVEVFFGGQGSTGYTTTPGAPKTAFGNTDRVSAVTSVAPNYLLVWGTQNDDANFASVQAAATAMFSAVATALPACEIILVGAASTRYDISGNRRDSTAALRAAAAAAPNVIGGYVIAPHMENWMTGNGNIATPDGNGIADMAMAADGNHPTVFGAAYVARRAMENIVWLFLRQGRFGPYGFTL